MSESTDGVGWALRGRYFPDEIHFHAPGLKRYETADFAQRRPQEFVAISLTGGACALQCDHCQGQMLHWMRPVSGDGGLYGLCQRLAQNGTRGVLISGGCDKGGHVPHLAFAEDLRRVKERLPLRVIVHTGLIDQVTAAALAEAGVDAAMIDIIGCAETIRRVYHLDARPEDFACSLGWLERYGIPALPHIVLGLHYGQFQGEATALELIAEHRVAGLILVVILPLVGTPMAHIRPPDSGVLGWFFEEARRKLPTTPVLLGCARPGGEAKVAIDRAAIDAGLNGIAYPAEGIIAYARRKGLAPRLHETCCGVGWLVAPGVGLLGRQAVGSVV